MDTEMLERALLALAESDAMADALAAEKGGAWLAGAWTFADRGILTTDRGIVLRLGGGAEFQITIVRSK